MVSAHLFEDPAPAMVRVSTIRPRDYQQKAHDDFVKALDRINRGLVTKPTGTGKTILFALVIQTYKAAGLLPIVVLAHREELIDQAAQKIAMVVPGIRVGIERANHKASLQDDVIVASVQTIGRTGSPRLEKIAKRKPKLLVIDEAHHAPADSYQIIMNALGCYTASCDVLGVTATANRLDNRPLHGDKDDSIFQEVVFEYSIRAAIDDGWLVDIRGFKVDTGLDLSKVKSRGGDYIQADLAKVVNTDHRTLLGIGAWANVAKDRKTIAFCADVEHAHDVASALRDHGIMAEAVDGTMPSHIRGAIMDRFRSGQTQILTNVEIATEGFDVLDVGAILMLRPTQSWSLYCQMVGRGTRPLAGTVDGKASPGERRLAILNSDKPDCIVVDVVDNTGKHTLASVPALLGLPPDLDLQGRKLTEAAVLLDTLGVRASAIGVTKNPRTFLDISKMIQEVDMLAVVHISEEVKRASRFSWLRMPDGGFALDGGMAGDRQGRRTARLHADALGGYHLEMHEHGRPPVLAKVGDELTQALRDADRLLTRAWPGVGAIASADARWRTGKPSEAQAKILWSWGINPLTLTKGQAHDMITERMESRQRKK